MKDLTQGPISRHIVNMAMPIAFGMIFQTLYYLVDLYFVARLGDAAIAGVGAAGNVMFIVLGLTQVLGVGTVALISHAVGRKDQAEANLFFNQAIVLSAACALITLVGGYAVTRPYIEAIAADTATVEAGVTYLHWFLPGMALQFAMVAMGSALRGTGIVKPTMVAQIVSVVLNIVLAPVLIAGWGTGYAMGVAGAGLASTLAIVGAVVLLSVYFMRLEKYVGFHSSLWRPQMAAWKRVMAIGLPAGGEFLLIFVFMGVVYWCIRDLGATAQAGFGIGSRVMQSIFLPAMAVAFAAGPIAGQNFGARQPERVRETFRKAMQMSAIIMATLTLLIHLNPPLLVQAFADDAEARDVAATFLAITSWNFVAQGVIFTCSAMFQGLGNTRPALISSASRLLIFALPAMWMSRQPWFELHYLWYVSVSTICVQAAVSWLLLRSQFQRRLSAIPAPAAA